MASQSDQLSPEDEALIRKVEAEDRRTHAPIILSRIITLENQVFALKTSIDDLLEIFNSVKAAIVLGGKLFRGVKWLAGVATAVMIIWAFVMAVKSGHPPAELPHLSGD